MKKNEPGVSLYFKGKSNVLLTMKLTLIFFFACFMQVSATVYSQGTKFTFDVKNKKIEDVLREIEEKSEFRFFYQREQIDVERKTNLNVDNQTVESILQQLFTGQDVVFEVREDNLILIKPESNTITRTSREVLQQQKVVRGKVTDVKGQGLPGVTVVVKGTTRGTITESDGHDILSNVPDNAVILFSFVGMKTKEVEVGNQSIINVTLEEKAIGLDEVVITALGIKKESKSLGYSTAQVTSDELTVNRTPNLMNALTGKMAGVSISGLGTGPGGNLLK